MTNRYYSRAMQAYALLIESKGIDMKHNTSPPLHCDGCDGWHIHDFKTEIEDREDESFVQIYTCSRCDTDRIYGRTVERVTPKGARN